MRQALHVPKNVSQWRPFKSAPSALKGPQKGRAKVKNQSIILEKKKKKFKNAFFVKNKENTIKGKILNSEVKILKGAISWPRERANQQAPKTEREGKIEKPRKKRGRNDLQFWKRKEEQNSEEKTGTVWEKGSF